MVFVTERVNFFKGIYHLSDVESDVQHAREYYGSIEHELTIEGGHIEVIARIAARKEARFEEMLTSALASEHVQG